MLLRFMAQELLMELLLLQQKKDVRKKVLVYRLVQQQQLKQLIYKQNIKINTEWVMKEIFCGTY